jgi:hypothetical protein
MMPISISQTQALVALIHQLRKDWDLAGIRAAIAKAATIGSAADIATAACRCAANPDMRTPALIAEPGPHWLGTTAGTRQAPIMCADHPQWKGGHCPQCFGERRPKPDNFVVPRPTRSRGYLQTIPSTFAAMVNDLTAARDKADAAIEETG